MNEGLLAMRIFHHKVRSATTITRSEDIAGKSERAGFTADLLQITTDLNPSLFKPKSKPPPTSAPLSLPKSKPPHLNLSFSKPKSKPYPKNYNLNLKRKRNKRKQRGREQSLSV